MALGLENRQVGNVTVVTCRGRLAAGPESAALQQHLRERFQVDATLLGGKLRIEHPRGHEFIPQLVEAFPGEIQSVMVAKPTLEDVFIRRTGHQFWEEAALDNERR